MADPVARLMRLRAAEADAARRDLAVALRAHDAAAEHLGAAVDRVHQEAAAAPSDPTHPLAPAFAIWLPQGAAAIQRARVEFASRSLALDLARGALAGARVAERACETLAEERAVERRAERLAAEQVLLEDLARGRV
jgi:hypothetical protein